MKQGIKRTFESNLVFFLFTLPLLLFLIFPRVDAWVRPPVTDFMVEDAFMSDGALILSGWMVKERGIFIGIQVTGKLDTGEEVHIPLTFYDDKGDHTSNRMRGLQTWGPWRLTVAVPMPRRVVSVSLTASHWLHVFGIRSKITEYGVQTPLLVDYPVPKS